MAVRNRRLTPKAAHLAAGSWFAAAALYLASEGAAAWAFSPLYSYSHNYISDLGVPVCGAVFDGRAICSPLHALVNADFVLQGLLFFAAALAIARSMSRRMRYALVASAAVNGIGISLVGLFPETAQAAGGPQLHALGALLAIVAGNATALISASGFRRSGLPGLHRAVSIALPCVAAVAFAMLLLARSRGATVGFPDGIWERASVYTITAWELLTAGCLWARLSSGDGPSA